MRQVKSNVWSSDASNPGSHWKGANGRIPDHGGDQDNVDGDVGVVVDVDGDVDIEFHLMLVG